MKALMTGLAPHAAALFRAGISGQETRFLCP